MHDTRLLNLSAPFVNGQAARVEVDPRLGCKTDSGFRGKLTNLLKKIFYESDCDEIVLITTVEL